MENLGSDMHHVHGALHYSHTACGDGGEQNKGTWSPAFSFDFNTTFHVFGIGASGCRASDGVVDVVGVAAWWRSGGGVVAWQWWHGGVAVAAWA